MGVDVRGRKCPTLRSCTRVFPITVVGSDRHQPATSPLLHVAIHLTDSSAFPHEDAPSTWHDRRKTDLHAVVTEVNGLRASLLQIRRYGTTTRATPMPQMH